MHHLRVTHILNVSTLIPNHFEASRKPLPHHTVGSIKVEYLRINIEDQDSVQIKMSFPLIFSFIDGAFEESRDFYKSPARSNPLVDDVFQSQMELGKRQLLKLKATALLDAVETDFSAIKGPKD
jgi:hypothetical protein